MEERLFTDFKSQTAEAWKEKLIADLKGKPFEDLLWENQGLSGKPFYTKADLPERLPQLSKVHSQPEAFGNRFWVNYQVIAVSSEKEANKAALIALEHGADGLLFSLSATPDFAILLKGIKVNYCHVSFESSERSTTAIYEDYLSYLNQIEADKSAVNGFIAGVGVHAQNEVQGLKTVMVKTNGQTNDSAKQIALQLADIIDLIDNLNIAPGDFFNMMACQLNLSKDYFGEIAHHRALRLMLHKLATAYEISIDEPMIFSGSSNWTSDINDTHSFMLHATTQAMSAIVGGTDGLLIRPFYSVFGENKSLAERMARNISTILKEESYLAKNVDPAAGSYYLESMTDALADKATAHLKSIESKGGLSKIDVNAFLANPTETV